MPMFVDLDELLGSMRDEQSFAVFIEALGADLASDRVLTEAGSSSSYGTGALGWKNAMKSLTTQRASRRTEVSLKVPAL